jgi:hypothetical protein
MTDPSLLQTMAAAIELHKQHQRVTATPREQIPDAVPHYLLTKRAASLTKPKEPAMASMSDLIKSADALIRSGDLDGADRALDRAMDKANHFHFYGIDDDEDDFESPSDPSNDDFDDDEDDVKKADEHYSYPHYGSTPSPATPSGHGTGPSQHSDPYRTDSWPTTGAPSRTAFDQKVDEVMARDGTSRHIAMATARNEFPREFTAHQNSLSEGPTRNQHARRSSGQATKSAPTYYEDLVAEQMAKGCSMEMAKVRVALLHGYDAQRMPSLMRKGADLGERFQRIVKRLAFENDISMEDATRLARHRNPHLYKAMNSV